MNIAIKQIVFIFCFSLSYFSTAQQSVSDNDDKRLFKIGLIDEKGDFTSISNEQLFSWHKETGHLSDGATASKFEIRKKQTENQVRYYLHYWAKDQQRNWEVATELSPIDVGEYMYALTGKICSCVSDNSSPQGSFHIAFNEEGDCGCLAVEGVAVEKISSVVSESILQNFFGENK